MMVVRPGIEEQPDARPYTSHGTHLMPPDRRRGNGWIVLRAALLGAFLTIGLAFPSAALLALAYRFPVPFAGYESGMAAVPHAILAVAFRSEEHTSELQSLTNLVCRLLLEKKKKKRTMKNTIY